MDFHQISSSFINFYQLFINEFFGVFFLAYINGLIDALLEINARTEKTLHGEKLFFHFNFFFIFAGSFPRQKNWLKNWLIVFSHCLSWSLALKNARRTPSPIQEPERALFREAQEAVGALGAQGALGEGVEDPIYEAMELSSPPLPPRRYCQEHKVQLEAPPKPPRFITTSFITPRLAQISEEINEDVDLK